MNPGDVSADWAFDDGHILILQAPKKGRTTPLAVLLSVEQAQQLISDLTAMIAAGPPVEEMEEDDA